jgi:hypothetical protein
MLQAEAVIKLGPCEKIPSTNFTGLSARLQKTRNLQHPKLVENLRSQVFERDSRSFFFKESQFIAGADLAR